MLLQQREAKKKKEKKVADDIAGQKGDEVYMMANSSEDAQRIYGVNDLQNRMKVRNRQAQIQSAGGEIVKEDDLLDVKMKIQRELNELTKRG
tara:strand:- start:1624 stop:1899 length:276 start_codon:yes stop_codon:yes gene_type:complete